MSPVLRHDPPTPPGPTAGGAAGPASTAPRAPEPASAKVQMSGNGCHDGDELVA